MIKEYWPLVVSALKARKKAVVAFVVSAVVVQLAKHGVNVPADWQDVAKSILTALIVALPVYGVRNA